MVARVHWYGWPEDESVFDGVDACILYADAGGAFAEEQYAVLDRQVKAGMAIMFLHYGVHPSKEIGEQFYKPWVGGYYDDAFSVNPSWIADLAAKSGHPVAHGLAAPDSGLRRTLLELEYRPREPGSLRAGHRGSDRAEHGPLRQQQVLEPSRRGQAGYCAGAALVSGPCQRRAAWRRLCGRPLPTCNWAIDDYRKLILNTIAWVTRVEVPVGGVPSQPLTKAQLNENLIRPEWPEQVELPTPDLLEQPGGTPPELGPDGRVPPRHPQALGKVGHRH